MTKVLSFRRFGVELEANDDYESNHYRIARNLEALGVPATSYDDEGDPDNNSAWLVKDDGSCGLEVASRPLRWTDWDEMVKVCDYLRSHYSVNSDCGLHVHHDFSGASGLELSRMLRGWAAYQPLLYMLVNASRVGNEFCQRLPAPQALAGALSTATTRNRLQRLRSWYQNNGRYWTLNLAPWWRIGTVEVRLHQGTLRHSTVRTWTMLTQSLLEHLVGHTMSTAQADRIYNLPMDQKLTSLLERLKDHLPDEEYGALKQAMMRRMMQYQNYQYTTLNLEAVYAAV